MAHELSRVSTDELLLRASKPESSGDFAEAVGELVMRYRTVVYSQALWVCAGNRSLADDVFQETFLRLFTWLKDRKGRPPLHSFARLLQVFAKRAAIDIVRKESREVSAPRVSDEQRWETQFYAVDLQELLRQLDTRYQEVVRLTYFEGLSAVEIAKRLNLKPGHVRILRFRALELLRELQRRDGVADSLEEL